MAEDTQALTLSSRGLTPKQQQFVAEYLIDLDATKAAIRAGYSRRTAEQQGCRLLRHPRVASAIAAGTQRKLAHAALTADRVLEEMRRVAFGDVRSLFDAQGHLRPIQDLTDEQAAVVASIEIVREQTAADGHVTSTDRIRRVKVWDKMRALEMLGKHFALLKEHVHVTGDAELVARLQAERRRVQDADATG